MLTLTDELRIGHPVIDNDHLRWSRRAGQEKGLCWLWPIPVGLGDYVGLVGRVNGCGGSELSG